MHSTFETELFQGVVYASPVFSLFDGLKSALFTYQNSFRGVI